MEAAIRVEIVNDHGCASSQDNTCTVDLKTHIAFAVQAVMDDQIDLPKLS